MPETQTPQFKLPDGFKLELGGMLTGRPRWPLHSNTPGWSGRP